jgi:hypothetical protein
VEGDLVLAEQHDRVRLERRGAGGSGTAALGWHADSTPTAGEIVSHPLDAGQP